MLARSARSLRKTLTGVRAFASGVPDVMVRARARNDRIRDAKECLAAAYPPGHFLTTKTDACASRPPHAAARRDEIDD